MRTTAEIEASNTKTPPKYLPGDLVELVNGCHGVITEAKNTINGGRVEWNKPFPSKIESMCAPTYSIQGIPGLSSSSKNAWYNEDEIVGFIENGKSELHKYRKYINNEVS